MPLDSVVGPNATYRMFVDMLLIVIASRPGFVSAAVVDTFNAAVPALTKLEGTGPTIFGNAIMFYSLSRSTRIRVNLFSYNLFLVTLPYHLAHHIVKLNCGELIRF